MAAYFGLLELARLRPGETVLVSAAANAAGAMAGQIAMLKGARAIGLASNREGCDWVTRHARLSACINPGAENVGARLKQLAPRGVDIYFDNTGGELLDTIVAGRHLGAGGRIVQNTVKAADPEAILARGGYLPKEGVQALRVRARDYEHRRTCCSRCRTGTSAGRWSESEGPKDHRACAGNARRLTGRPDVALNGAGRGCAHA